MSDPAAPSLHLVFPSDTRYLHAVTNLARNAAISAGLSEADADKVALATDEAVTNVIEHAYRGNDRRPIELKVVEREDRIELHVIHEGTPVDEGSLPVYDPEAYLQSRRRGGLGVVLMRRLMDKVEFRATGDRRSECCLEKRRKP